MQTLDCTSNLLETVETLGKTVDERWGKAGRDPNQFSKIAFEALETSRLHEKFTMEDFLQSFWEKKELPFQHDRRGSFAFGEPSVTLYYGKDFALDIYFWTSPQISVHSHCFHGAFTVLSGLSLHCVYDFQPQDDSGTLVQRGAVPLRKAELLRSGETREILAGSELIHQVWHLSFPTVSFALRTAGEGSGTQIIQQNKYFRPHLAVATIPSLTPLETKQRDLLYMLHRVRDPLETVYLTRFLTEATADRALLFLSSYLTMTGDLSLIDRVVRGIPKLERWAPFLLESLQRVIEPEFHLDEVEEEGEKFLIALLDSATDRGQMEELLQAYRPGAPFEATIFGWLQSLLERDKLNFRLNETAWDILLFLSRGDGEEAICRKIAGMYEVVLNDKLRQEIGSVCKELAGYRLLKPLIPPSKQGEITQRLLPLQDPRAAVRSFTKEETNQFNENGYLAVKRVLDDNVLAIFLNYFSFLERNQPDFSGDGFVKDAKARYSDPLCESLLLHVQPILEKATGRKLFPTYAYMRIYGPGSILAEHTDRPSCEISATLTLGYKAPAIWPIFVRSNGKDIPVHLDRGDMLIYKGCELPHWRKPLQGDYTVQAFLHFVDQNGKNADWKYDKRAPDYFE